MTERSVKAIFGEAIEKHGTERSAFLDGACRGDPELRSQVDSLIGAWERADEFLASPTTEKAPDSDTDLERPGARIGAYKLLQRIGEGGMGMVYMAEQEEPVRRKVALKIIKLGMDTKQVIARFEAERQALAMMDHPNIAKVFDAGATETGRPYFVMELVRGVAINEYCDTNNLSTKERLRLFIAVCNAAQHAHQKGIIHRDLKPSNVLVTLHDGVPVPKVIDFGIAKATSSRLTDKTLFTEFRSFLGTPEYMSPEQAEMSGLDIDTRSDIYALGVLLYELLTGTTPFDALTLRQAAFDELQRIIREDEPPKPSTRISTLVGESRTSTARRRDTDPAGLSRVVRGDLDWIVMKALEKDRTRRYETASALAEDVRRHLASEPVLASPPTLTYTLSKFVRRNRIAVAAGAAVLFLLLLATLGTTWGFVVARGEREVAMAARSEAEAAQIEAQRRAQEARDAREEETAQREAAERARTDALAAKDLALREAVRAGAVTDFLVDTLSLASPGAELAPDLTMHAVLDRAGAQVGRRFEGQPQAEAVLRATIGKAYYSLGELHAAEPHLRRAIELWDLGAEVDDWMLYETLWPLTSTVFALGSSEIQTFGQRVMLLGFQMIGEDHAELTGALAAMINGKITGDDPGAQTGYENAMRIAQAELAPDDPLWRLIADDLFVSGYVPWYFRNDPSAEVYIRDALTIYRRVLPETHPQVVTTLEMIVSILNGTGEYEEAEARVRESLELLRRSFPPGHGYFAASKGRLGRCLTGQGRFEEAEGILLEAMETGLDEGYAATEILSATVGLYDAWGRPDVAESYRTHLAATFITRGYVPALAVIRPAFGPELAPLLAQLEQLQSFSARLPNNDQDEQALVAELQILVDEYIHLRRDLVPETHPLAALIARELMNWTGQWGIGLRFEELRGALIDDARSILQHWEAELPDAFGWSLYQLALLEEQAGGFEHAELMLREALELTIVGLGESSSVAATMMVDLARVLRSLGRDAEAEPLLTQAYPIFVEQIGAQNRKTFDCVRSIERIYRERENSEGARSYVKEGVDALKRLAGAPSIQSKDLFDYATFLLECTPADLRAPETAALMAHRANELNDGRRLKYIELLARARAAMGEFDSAIELLHEAMDLVGLDHPNRPDLESRLEEFQAEAR